MAVYTLVLDDKTIESILLGYKTVMRLPLVDQPYEFTGDENHPVPITKDGRYLALDENNNYMYVKAPYVVGDEIQIRKYITSDQCDSCNLCSSDVNYASFYTHDSLSFTEEINSVYLSVTNVCIARLQNMYASDACKEGLHPIRPMSADAMVEIFIHKWNASLQYVDMDRFCWDANPWVWIIDFDVIKNN